MLRCFMQTVWLCNIDLKTCAGKPDSPAQNLFHSLGVTHWAHGPDRRFSDLRERELWCKLKGKRTLILFEY